MSFNSIYLGLIPLELLNKVNFQALSWIEERTVNQRSEAVMERLMIALQDLKRLEQC